MAIKLQQPSLALNSFNVPGYEYSMWQTWKMPKNATPRDVVNWILYACDHAPEMELKHVILNTHGLDGKIFIGRDNRGCASPLTITTLVFLCLAVQGHRNHLDHILPGGPDLHWQVFLRGNGQGRDVQCGGRGSIQRPWWTPFGVLFMPSGNIDDYEGNVYRWDCSGNMENFFPNGGSF